MKTILLTVLLLMSGPATALICEDRGTCADSRLNQTYEIKKEVRWQGEETRRVIRDEKRLREQREIQRREHKARRNLLDKKKPPSSLESRRLF